MNQVSVEDLIIQQHFTRLQRSSTQHEKHVKFNRYDCLKLVEYCHILVNSKVFIVLWGFVCNSTQD